MSWLFSLTVWNWLLVMDGLLHMIKGKPFLVHSTLCNCIFPDILSCCVYIWLDNFRCQVVNTCDGSLFVTPRQCNYRGLSVLTELYVWISPYAIASFSLRDNETVCSDCGTVHCVTVNQIAKQQPKLSIQGGWRQIMPRAFTTSGLRFCGNSTCALVMCICI